MSGIRPQFVIDENLRFVPADPTALLKYVDSLKSELKEAIESSQRVSLMGEIAVYLRSLDQFEEAENFLLAALQIISSQNLGIAREVQQKIRLAHVYQEKKDFSKSDALFSEILKLCRENEDASQYLDFALQHSGKNYFDQANYSLAMAYFSDALELRLRKNSPPDQVESSQVAIRRTQERMAHPDQLRKAQK